MGDSLKCKQASAGISQVREAAKMELLWENVIFGIN